MGFLDGLFGNGMQADDEGALPGNAQPTQGYLPPQPPPQPGMFGNGLLGGAGFNHAMMNPMVMMGLGLASGKTPQEGLGNAAKMGFGAAEYQQKREEDQRSKAMIYQAAIKMGLSPPEAMAFAANPQAVNMLQQRALEQQRLNKPELVEGGTDPFSGQKSWLWKHSNSERLTPANPETPSAEGGTAPSASLQGTVGKIRALGPEASIDDKIAAMPEAGQGYMKALLKGEAFPQSMGRVTGQTRAAYLSLAHEIDPNFDEGDIAARQSFARSMGNLSIQSYGGQVASAGTIVNHSAKAQESLAEMLKLAPVPYVDTGGSVANPMIDWVNKNRGNADFNRAYGRYKEEAGMAAKETERLATQGRGTGAERMQHLANTDPAHNSISAVMGGWEGIEKIMLGRLDEVGAAKTRAYKKETSSEELLSPQARQALERTRARRQQFFDQRAGVAPGPAESTKVGAPAPTATNPKTGEKMILRNGEWQKM